MLNITNIFGDTFNAIPPNLCVASHVIQNESMVDQQSIHKEQHMICFTNMSSNHMHANDPSAGSPTETLLRLLLPLSDKVH